MQQQISRESWLMELVNIHWPDHPSTTHARASRLCKERLEFYTLRESEVYWGLRPAE